MMSGRQCAGPCLDGRCITNNCYRWDSRNYRQSVWRWILRNAGMLLYVLTSPLKVTWNPKIYWKWSPGLQVNTFRTQQHCTMVWKVVRSSKEIHITIGTAVLEEGTDISSLHFWLSFSSIFCRCRSQIWFKMSLKQIQGSFLKSLVAWICNLSWFGLTQNWLASLGLEKT